MAWMRIIKPEYGNPYYNTVSAGGYSTCIPGGYNERWANNYRSWGHNVRAGDSCKGYNVLPNCVGLANGAFNETYVRNMQLKGESVREGEHFNFNCNANGFINRAKQIGVPTRNPDQRPPLGGMIIYGNASSSVNHVAFITNVIDNNTIEIIQSGWGGWNGNWGAESDPVWPIKVLRTTRSSGWYDGNGPDTGNCIGFVVNPALSDDDVADPSFPPDASQTKYGVRIQSQLYAPLVYHNGKWERLTAEVYHNGRWIKTD